MADAPYFITDTVVLGAGGTGTWNFSVPANENYDVYDMRFSATGGFDVRDIRDSAGVHYTNASSVDPLPSVQLQNGNSPNIGFQSFPVTLHLDGATQLQVDLFDTSGAGNTVRLTFLAIRHTP